MPDALMNLPWQIQLSIASGYAAYLLCYVGIRSKHTTVDVTFLTLTFGFIATGTYYIASKKFNEVGSCICAFSAAILAGLLWRRFFRGMLRRTLRKFDVSWSDDSPTALASIIADSTRPMSQISVLHEDGTWLRCDNLAAFEKMPFGPCRIGGDGDVAIYLTHTVDKNGNVKEMKSVIDENYGSRITIIPASKIKLINCRHV